MSTMTSSAASVSISSSSNGIDQASQTGDAVRNLMDQFAQEGRADVAFGSPHVIGARTLIPVARITYAFGGGSGDSTRQKASAAGGLAVRPFAVIEVTQDKVRVVPIVDVHTVIGRILGFAVATTLIGAFLRRPRVRQAGLHVKI